MRRHHCVNLGAAGEQVEELLTRVQNANGGRPRAKASQTQRAFLAVSSTAPVLILHAGNNDLA